MKIVILDCYTVSLDDLNWDCVKALGDVTIYDHTPADKIIERMQGCDIVLANKCRITADIMDACPGLKMIQVLATGYDSVDTKAARERGIAVCNIPSYSTESVVQHTIALMLETANNVGLHTKAIHDGAWTESRDFCFMLKPVVQLSGKSLGIIGYGHIGKRVGQVAEALGMKVNVYSRDPEAAVKSDFITLHCPATAENNGFINKKFISRMKDGAVLINTARGALVNEEDLVTALRSGKLAAAAVDVINGEPQRPDHPFIGCPNLYVTPHIAWASHEARKLLIDITADNIRAFLNGEEKNRVENK